ncbi:hypothetical protein AAHA92_05097 [Salvia divinorum]|uniref:Uncharacterized protein n=1 Tax=Salvia divinorum TaxID=28513 RepID=A0ABD1I2A6_SALDI
MKLVLLMKVAQRYQTNNMRFGFYLNSSLLDINFHPKGLMRSLLWWFVQQIYTHTTKISEGTSTSGLVLLNSEQNQNDKYHFLVNPNLAKTLLQLDEFSYSFSFCACRSNFLGSIGLVEHAGTRWDKSLNKVFASEKIWTTVLMNSELVGTYTIDGKPEFKQLQMLFSGECLKQDKKDEVITITDTIVEAEIYVTTRLGKAHVHGQSSSVTAVSRRCCSCSTTALVASSPAALKVTRSAVVWSACSRQPDVRTKVAPPWLSRLAAAAGVLYPGQDWVKVWCMIMQI